MSSRETQEISEEERRYEDGTFPKVLDTIRIALREPRPSRHQSENHLIDDSAYWVRSGAIGWQALQSFVEVPTGNLWINGHSTYRGANDQVPETILGQLGRSLYLINPQDLRLTVERETSPFAPPKRKVRAEFNYNGAYYRLSVTDPWMEQRMLAQADGEYPVREALLCVSLGEVFQGNAYKLAATVITRDRANGE